MQGWDRTTEREVDWVSGCCMLLPRKVFDEVGLLDESFLLYGEELDLATRLRGAGWSVLFSPRVEVLHAIGVSTGRSRRMTVMHSASIYRYYRKHRAVGWRKLTLPIAWMALRVRAEVAWMKGRFAG
jgi:GT2 family glycosyltransferase